MGNLLVGEKIRLRPLEPEDLEILYRWENDSDLWPVSNTLAPYSRFALKQYLEEARADIYSIRQLRLVMVDRQTEEPVGMIDLFDFDPYHLRAGVGIMVNKTFRNKGMAGEALEILSHYAFDHLHLFQLYAQIPANNEASLQLFSQKGFQQTGCFKSWLRGKNGYEDQIMTQLLAADFFDGQ